MEISLVLSIFEMKVDLKKGDCDIYNSKSDNKSFGKTTQKVNCSIKHRQYIEKNSDVVLNDINNKSPHCAYSC